MELTIPQKYRQDIENLTNLLKDEGCEAIFLFGSLVTGKIHENSDIDIGIKGLPPEKFFRVYSKIYFKFDTKIDLVDFDMDNDLYSMLNSLGELIQVG